MGNIEDRMLKVERESAINSQKAITHRNELNELFALFRKHMDTEEKQRQELIGLISAIGTELGKQKSFVAGITFTVSIMWIIGIAAWHYFIK